MLFFLVWAAICRAFADTAKAAKAAQTQLAVDNRQLGMLEDVVWGEQLPAPDLPEMLIPLVIQVVSIKLTPTELAFCQLRTKNFQEDLEDRDVVAVLQNALRRSQPAS